MHIVASALLVAAIAVASPIKARTPYALKETHYAPREWQKLGRANPSKLVNLQIGLKQGNMVRRLRIFLQIGVLTCYNRTACSSTSTRSRTRTMRATEPI